MNEGAQVAPSPFLTHLYGETALLILLPTYRGLSRPIYSLKRFMIDAGAVASQSRSSQSI